MLHNLGNRSKTRLAMKPNEFLALAVRILAVIGLAFVTRNLVNDLLLGSSDSLVLTIGKRVVYLLIGLYFLRGAPGLLHFAYPEEPKSAAGETVSSHSAA